ncbi:YefM-like antitoxin [Synechococcus phage S-CREM1]|nr:YefM-like antitoxin [Synechococcus phage S-CREM1]
MNQVPVINVSELGEYAEFIIDALVVRNKMSLRITSDDGDALLVPVIEKSPVPEDVLKELEEMQKVLETPETSLAGPPPLDMPF